MKQKKFVRIQESIKSAEKMWDDFSTGNTNAYTWQPYKMILVLSKDVKSLLSIIDRLYLELNKKDKELEDLRSRRIGANY